MYHLMHYNAQKCASHRFDTFDYARSHFVSIYSAGSIQFIAYDLILTELHSTLSKYKLLNRLELGAEYQ